MGMIVCKEENYDLDRQSIFKPHSTRSASTSKAKLSDVPLADILDEGEYTLIIRIRRGVKFFT